MSKIRPGTVDNPNEQARLRDLAQCEECGAGGLDSLEDIQVGGDGVWEDRLMCLRCAHYWRVNHQDVIIPLMQRKYGFSRDEAETMELRRRKRWQRQLSREQVGQG